MSTKASTAALDRFCQRLLRPQRRAPRHPASGQEMVMLGRSLAGMAIPGKRFGRRSESYRGNGDERSAGSTKRCTNKPDPAESSQVDICRGPDGSFDARRARDCFRRAGLAPGSTRAPAGPESDRKSPALGERGPRNVVRRRAAISFGGVATHRARICRISVRLCLAAAASKVTGRGKRNSHRHFSRWSHGVPCAAEEIGTAGLAHGRPFSVSEKIQRQPTRCLWWT
jgi:hypothetical protein